MSADPTGLTADVAVEYIACSVCGAQRTESCIPDSNEMEWDVHTDRIWDYRDACRKIAAQRIKE